MAADLGEERKSCPSSVPVSPFALEHDPPLAELASRRGRLLQEAPTGALVLLFIALPLIFVSGTVRVIKRSEGSVEAARRPRFSLTQRFAGSSPSKSSGGRSSWAACLVRLG